MKRKSILMVSFMLLCCGSAFSQELRTTQVVKEKPAQRDEKSLNQAKPLSSNTSLQYQSVKLDSSKKEEQVVDRKTKKSSPKTSK